VTPSANPISSSWRKIRNQSPIVTSPSAIARVISVAACDPELPPVEMHSGKNRASAISETMALS
jgi:hypothetical protein